MSLGNDIKSAVDYARDTLGSAGTLNGVTDLGMCSFEELGSDRIQSFIGSDYENEVDAPWALVEIDASFTIVEGDKITIGGDDWVVRRVMAGRAAGIKIANRCICIGQLKR